MKTLLLNIGKYLLLIEEGDKIEPCKPSNICLAHQTKPCENCLRYGGRRVIAYYPLSDKSDNLKLPLLPPPANHHKDKTPTGFVLTDSGNSIVIGHNGTHNKFGTIAFHTAVNPDGNDVVVGEYEY